MKELSAKGSQKAILISLLNKYQADPERFHSYLPEVARELDQLLPARRRSSPRSALTELERERLHKALLPLVSKKELIDAEAIQALEYCATLIQDGSLPAELDRKTLLNLLHQATGLSISKAKRATNIPLRQEEAIKAVALLRGVHLHLTRNDRLAAISILPAKFKERSKALKLVATGKDGAPDVAQQHDTYLAEALSDAVA